MAQLPSQQLALKLRDLTAPMRAGQPKPGPIPGVTPSGATVAPPSVAGGPSGRPPAAPAAGSLLNQPLTPSPAPGAPSAAPTPAAPPTQAGSEGVSKIEFARDTLTDKAKAAATTAESQAKIAQDQAAFQAEQARVQQVQAQAEATKNFGAVPTFASMPGAPPLPINQGGSSFNPITGTWSGQRQEPLQGQGQGQPQGTPPTKPGDPPPVGNGGGFLAPPQGMPGDPREMVTSNALGPEVKPVQVPLADILRRRAAAMRIHGGKAGPQV